MAAQVGTFGAPFLPEHSNTYIKEDIGQQFAWLNDKWFSGGPNTVLNGRDNVCWWSQLELCFLCWGHYHAWSFFSITSTPPQLMARHGNRTTFVLLLSVAAWQRTCPTTHNQLWVTNHRFPTIDLPSAYHLTETRMWDVSVRNCICAERVMLTNAQLRTTLKLSSARGTIECGNPRTCTRVTHNALGSLSCP